MKIYKVTDLISTAIKLDIKAVVLYGLRKADNYVSVNGESYVEVDDYNEALKLHGYDIHMVRNVASETVALMDIN